MPFFAHRTHTHLRQMDSRPVPTDDVQDLSRQTWALIVNVLCVPLIATVLRRPMIDSVKLKPLSPSYPRMKRTPPSFLVYCQVSYPNWRKRIYTKKCQCTRRSLHTHGLVLVSKTARSTGQVGLGSIGRSSQEKRAGSKEDVANWRMMLRDIPHG